MSLNDFLLMRHELLLVITLLVLLFADLLWSPNKLGVRMLALVLFTLVTVAGFLPYGEGTSLFGEMYQISDMRIMMKNVLNIGVLIVFIQSFTWLKKAENSVKISEFFILILSTLIGMNYMISAGDFLMFYLGLELATIPVAALAAYDRYKNTSAEAGIKLILSSALSSGILLYGISMLYGATGSVYFTEVNSAVTKDPIIILAMIFFFAGMAFKISLVPFHLWTADVYEGAPISITSYLSVISKAAAAFIFMIVLFIVFPKLLDMWQDVIYVLAVATMTIGNLFAIRQQNLKRFLAFSSIAQAGFILLGIISGTEMGMTSVVYFALIYIFSNLGAFGVVAAISNATGKEKIEDYNGLYRTNSKLALVMTLALFSLAGIPPVAGFFGKFFLFTAAAKGGFYILVLISVINAIISLYYYLLVVKAMFIVKNPEPIAYFRSDFWTRTGLIICVTGIITIGFASYIFEYFNSISFGIFGM